MSEHGPDGGRQYLFDATGSTAALADADAEATDRFVYRAFGGPESHAGASAAHR